MPEILIRDEFILSSQDIIDNVRKDYSSIKDSEENRVLSITVDATHAGYFNKNNYYYEPKGMANSVSSWIIPYSKPVLRHHQDSTDPIGRVTDAAYIPVMKASTDDPHGSPEGKIRLRAEISDPDAIEKILSGVYYTVSVGGSLKSAPKCSICGEPVEMSPLGFSMKCEHEPGKIYDGKYCGYVIDGVEYKEISFVNMPADYSQEHVAKVVNMEFGNSSDPIRIDTESTEDEDNNIKVEDEVKAKNEVKTKMEVKDMDFEKLIEQELEKLESCESCDEDGVDSLWSEEEKSEVSSLDDEFVEEVEEIFDKTVPRKGSSARKKMAESVFCGPDRTFPIPDCKHAAVAIAMLHWPRIVKKYSASTRARIEACVRRKAKKLGCPMSKKDSLSSFIALIKQEFVKQNNELASKLDESKNENKAANDKINELTAQLRRGYAEKIVDLSIMLKRPSVKHIIEEHDSDKRKDLYDEYVETLLKRTSDSLQDTISDLRADVSIFSVQDKVNDPVGKTDNTTLHVESRKEKILRKLFGK